MAKKLAENLKLLLDKHKINSSQLSMASGVDKPRISRLLSGKTTNPQIDTIQPIAEFFGVTIDQLVGSSPLPMEASYGIVVPVDRLLIPIIEWRNAPYWLEIKDRFLPKRTIDAKSNISSDAFALVIENETYEPKFSAGTILIVDPTEKPKSRDYIITNDPLNDDITIRQLIIEKNKNFIKFVGGSFKMEKIEPVFKCFGVVVEMHSNMIQKDTLKGFNNESI